MTHIESCDNCYWRRCRYRRCEQDPCEQYMIHDMRMYLRRTWTVADMLAWEKEKMEGMK